MTSEVYNQFVDDKSNGKDIYKSMPAGIWRDMLEKPKSL